MSVPPPPAPEETPFERAPSRGANIIVLCDHATNQRPRELGDLGLPGEEFDRHIAYDVGARGVAAALAAEIGAAYIGTTFSRLVIDPNRGEDDPTLIMRLYDRTIIPGNARVDEAERERRLDAYHRPYHCAIDAMMAEMTAEFGRPPLIFSIHSYTRQLRGRPARPWHVGVLWNKDRATASRLLETLRAAPDLVVGDNEPYSGSLPGDTVDRHGAGCGARHVLLEIRNDLIETDDAQRVWADRLAPMASALAD